VRRSGLCVAFALAGCNLVLPLDTPALDSGAPDSPAVLDATAFDAVPDGTGPPLEHGWPEPDSSWPADVGSPLDKGVKHDAAVKSDLAALALAKKCSPMLPVQQCTQLADNKLACPCKTFVNPNNTAALGTMSSLKSQWLAQGCNKGIYCPLGCMMPISGQCSGNGGCVDNYM